MTALLSIWGWIASYWYILLGLGAVALAVAYFFMGRQLLDIVKVVFDFAFKTTAGMVIICIIVACILLGGAYTTGRDVEKAKCDAQVLRKELSAEKQKVDDERRAHADTLERLRVANEVLGRDADRAAEAEARYKDLEGKINAPSTGPVAPAVKCLSPDDARSVYDVR